MKDMEKLVFVCGVGCGWTAGIVFTILVDILTKPCVGG
jgi:hypothetical protein